MSQVQDPNRFKSGQTWIGRSLVNYIALHPKAKGAPTLTKARQLAFGAKPKNLMCKCGQMKCERDDKGYSHC